MYRAGGLTRLMNEVTANMQTSTVIHGHLIEIVGRGNITKANRMVIGKVTGKEGADSGIMVFIPTKESKAKSPSLGLQSIITMACLFQEWQKYGSKVRKNWIFPLGVELPPQGGKSGWRDKKHPRFILILILI
jgi:hypothetical protein